LMAEVYLIVSADWDDYSVHAAYKDERRAEAVAKRENKRCGCDEYSVQVVPLDVDRGERTQYCVVVDIQTGEEIADRRYTRNLDPWTEQEEEAGWSSAVTWAWSTRGYKVAVKAARDKRARLQAEEAGVG